MVSTLLVYGATSFTAQNLLPYLDNHPDANKFDFILGGRNRQKLEDVNAKLSRPRETAVCDLKDDGEVEKMVKRGKVVLNLAGPYRTHGGEAIVRACAKLGVHYVDLCGEITWVSQILIPKYHDLAKKSKACIVPSCGFDSIPSDITLYVAQRTLQDAHPKMKIEKSISMFRFKLGASGGTMASLKVEAGIMAEGGRKWFREWAATGEDKRKSTPPRFSYFFPWLGKYGAYFFMYGYNRTVVRRSQYLSWTAPSNKASDSNGNGGGGGTKNKEPVYAKEMQYAECARYGSGSWLSAIFASSIISLFIGLFFASKLVRWLVDPFLPAPGTGPSQKELEAGWCATWNVSQSDSKPPMEVRTTYKGQGDPGYLHTCYLLAESALALVIKAPAGTSLPPRASEGGILTPASALGMVLVERLRKSGKVQLESEIVTTSDKKKIE